MDSKTTAPVLGAYNGPSRRHQSRFRFAVLFGLLLVFIFAYLDSLKPWARSPSLAPALSSHIRSQRAQILSKCIYIKTPAGPPSDFASRTRSDRLVAGTNPILITNAKILTGARNGTELVLGDLLLDQGLIAAVGYVPPKLLENAGSQLEVWDAKGAWVTPGLVDLHSHIGVESSPGLHGIFHFLSMIYNFERDLRCKGWQFS